MKYLPYLLSVLLVCYSVFLFLSSQSNVESSTLNWEDYSRSRSGLTGYLLSLSNEELQKNIYISVDKKINTQNIKLVAGWEIKLISEAEIWNPRVCARMPLVIVSNGDVFMYETERKSAGNFVTKIIWFNKSQNKIIQAYLQPNRFVGSHLFRSELGLPYYLTKEEQIFKKNIIDIENNALNKQSIVELSSEESLTVELESRNKPLLKIYNARIFSSQLFAMEDGTLILQDKPTTYSVSRSEGESYNIHDIENDLEARYRPGGPYETSVLYRGEPVASFIPEMKVYSYVIGSY
jgi:hypothetical protein